MRKKSLRKIYCNESRGNPKYNALEVHLLLLDINTYEITSV